MNYRKFLSERFKIVNKKQEVVPFVVNNMQGKILDEMTGRDIVLKPRQLGVSSVILAAFAADFILTEHSFSVVVADIDDNATGLLDKVKFYLQSYEDITKRKIPLKYNSRYELFNPFMGTTFRIGTARNVEFGRSRTINNLHLSELAFYPDPEKIIAGAGQAVTENGKFIIETTANGFNDFKRLWDDAKSGTSNFKPHFFKASDFYDDEFLRRKKVELGEKFAQEYPETDTEAFLTSGNCFFDKTSLSEYLKRAIDPMKTPQFGSATC